MRSFLAAAALVLALPAAMPAQALHTGVSHLVATMDAPEFAFQANAVKVAVPQIYTGLIAPVRLNGLTLAGLDTKGATAVKVHFTVDTNGVPQDIAVETPLEATAAAKVIAAVGRMRYTPGKLNGQPVATPVVLNIAFTE